MEFSRQRGTVDLYGDELKYFEKIEQILRYVSSLYNLKEIRTPIFESTNLFTKAVGESSDIVHKEFYNFKDKGDREIALRPEGTAGTIRAIVEEKMLANLSYPLKLFYIGPMFRYERPQSGRQRQFHQYGIEVVGNITTYDEVETISLATNILRLLGVTKYNIEINNIGSSETRKKWIDALKDYFSKYKNELSEDSLRRLETNPLRILDDKVDGSKDFVKNAPKLDKFLTNEEKQYFDEVKKLLDLLKINYTVNDTLVRGLDYYTGIVFEFVSTSDKLKGQSTIIGGGKYEGLVSLTGGPDVAGIGFGLGIERIIIAIKDENENFIDQDEVDYLIAPISSKAVDKAFLINALIRTKGFKSVVNYNSTKLDKSFKYAERLNAKNIIIIGDKEVENKELVIKNQTTNKEEKVKFSDLDNFLGK